MTPWFRCIRPLAGHALIALVLGWSGAASVGSARTTDLSDGLTYLRIKELDAQPMPPATAALVLDLRGTRASPESASRLIPLVDVPGPGAIRLVLLDPDTAKPLLDVFKVKRRGVLTLAAAHESIAVDIAVATAPDDDRQARNAIDGDAPLADLLEPKQRWFATMPTDSLCQSLPQTIKRQPQRRRRPQGIQRQVKQKTDPASMQCFSGRSIFIRRSALWTNSSLDHTLPNVEPAPAKGCVSTESLFVHRFI